MIILVILIALVLLAPYVYIRVHKDKTIDEKDFNRAIAQLKAAHALTDTDEPENSDTSGRAKLTKFNPNHLPADQWHKLGLSDKQVATIQRYEAGGGKFYTREDVKKMHAITADDYARLKPHLDLPDSSAVHHGKPFVIVELNTADSAALTKVRGIGPAFAMRIVHYRERLGGFYRKEQLKEVFGIDDGKYEELQSEFTVDARRLKKIHINTVDFEGLKNNPYLNFKQANAIIMYRKEHGDYENLAEMKNVVILNVQILRKLAPYLIFR